MNIFIALMGLSLNPIIDLPGRALEAFIKSLTFMIVVIFAAVPWVALFLLSSYGALRFLRWWIKRRREMKEKVRQTEPGKAAGLT